MAGLEASSAEAQRIIDGLSGSVLVITPLYPSDENPYACAFVHTRVKAYRAAGLAVDVVARSFDGRASSYEFEGAPVSLLPNGDLQVLLRTHAYRTICVHFIEMQYARVLESCDLSASRILVWCHGGESLYWDRPLFTTPYFARPRVLPEVEKADLRERDAMLARFNGRPNVTFVFVSDFAKRRSEELLGIEWRSARVIPNPIDFGTFAYRRKAPELRWRVFTVKTQDDLSCYAVDTVVRTIVELSRRPCFADMEFTVAGTGAAHAELVEPLAGFSNVNVIDRFLTHDEIAALHRQSGIGLFPTRFDAQGVSMCEAAASGLAVVSTDRPSVADFLADDAGLLAPVDDFRAYADIIERLHDDPAYFERACEASYRKVARSCAPERTMERELALVAEGCEGAGGAGAAAGGTRPSPATVPFAENGGPLLTIAVIGGDDAALAALRAAGIGADGRVECVAANSACEAAARARGRFLKVLGPRDFADLRTFGGLLDVLGRTECDCVLTDCLELSFGVEEACVTGGFDFMMPGVGYAPADLECGAYGFSELLPDWPHAVLATSVARAVAAELPDVLERFDYSVLAWGLIGRMEYYPHAVWQVRLAPEGAGADGDSEEQGKDAARSFEPGAALRSAAHALMCAGPISRLIANGR